MRRSLPTQPSRRNGRLCYRRACYHEESARLEVICRRRVTLLLICSAWSLMLMTRLMSSGIQCAKLLWVSFQKRFLKLIMLRVCSKLKISLHYLCKQWMLVHAFGATGDVLSSLHYWPLLHPDMGLLSWKIWRTALDFVQEVRRTSQEKIQWWLPGGTLQYHDYLVLANWIIRSYRQTIICPCRYNR